MNKEILRLAIPNIISNLSVPILSLTDIGLLGQLNSEIYIASLALSTAVFNIIYWMFSFIRMSSTGFTAQAYGRNNTKETKVLFHRSTIISLAIGLCLMAFSPLIETVTFHFMQSSPETISLAKEYFRIRILSAPATLLMFALLGWLIGMQNAKIPMVVTIITNILNIILSYTFVNILDMDVKGTAYGTVIAEYIAMIITIVVIFKKYRNLFTFDQNLSSIINARELKNFMSVNRDIFIRTLCLILVFNFFIMRSATYGDEFLSANTLLIQLTMFFSYFTDGIAYASEALVGKYLGFKSLAKLYKLIKHLFVWALAMSIAFSGIFFLFGDDILHLLSKQKNVIEIANEYLIWVIIIPIVSFASYIWDGIYIGLLAGKEMRNTMILATFPIFFGIYFLFNNSLGNHALWLGLFCFLGVRGLSQTFLAKKIIQNKLHSSS